MRYIKLFEGIRSEYPEMFGPRNPEDEPKDVPGFESGTIDPDDEEPYGDNKSDKERYKDFLKITKERNIQETENEIVINLKRLYEDFYMSIMNGRTHFSKFINKILLNKYISSGFEDIITDVEIEGTIQRIYILYDDYSAFINLTLKEHKFSENTFCKDRIVIDKIKSDAARYNL